MGPFSRDDTAWSASTEAIVWRLARATVAVTCVARLASPSTPVVTMASATIASTMVNP